MTRTHLATLSSLCLLLACGPDSATTEDMTPSQDMSPDTSPDTSTDVSQDMPPARTVTLDTFRAEVRDAFCDAYYTCPNAAFADQLSYAARYPDADACKADDARTFGTWSLEESVRRGDTMFDADAALTCLDDLPDALCTGAASSIFNVPSCQDVYGNDAEVGDACIDSLGCPAGAFCPTFQSGCDSVCTLPSTSCGEASCVPGERCDRLTNTCSPALEAGEPCFEPDACAPGSRCTVDRGVACTGDMCSYVPADEPPGTCAEPGTQAQGAPCTGTDSCGMGLVCSLEKTCEPLILGMVGEMCTLFDARTCAPGLVCALPSQLEFDGTCSLPARSGQPCNQFDQCVQGAYCDVNAGTCKVASAEGAPCQFAGECVTGLCAGGVCAIELTCP